MDPFEFNINPALDIDSLKTQYDAKSRVQIRNVLSAETAKNIGDMLQNHIPWGLAWQASANGPNYERADTLSTSGQSWLIEIQSATFASAGTTDYAFQFGSYPMLKAYLERWQPNSPQDNILEHINNRPFMDLVRSITGISALKKADAQATVYGPGHFLAEHDDSHIDQGWQVAYVLDMCAVEWRPDWGGYLNFLDEDGDVIEGWQPRFNTLKLFRVPQRHMVSFVPQFSPMARFAITGWFRDI